MSTVVSENARRGGLALQLALVAFLRSGVVQSIGAICTMLLLAWGASYAAGGSHTSLPHLFYLPVVLAATRFSWGGALSSSLVATLLAGPALPSVVETGQAQPLETWLVRGAGFTFVSLFVAWGLRARTESLGTAVQDAITSAHLARGIARGEVTVAYQPIVHVATGEVVAVEALARWHHPRRGPVSPAEFIPAAERTGAITVLDRHVLREAVRQAHTWAACSTAVKVSVNVSAARLADPALPADVEHVLGQVGLDADLLQVEITESAVINDPVAAAEQVRRLRDLGVAVAIDDFGAGHASLGYLNDFTVDTVKIDRSLVADIAEKPQAARLVAAMVHLFRSLRLEVVAEGVETAEQCGHLASAGCTLAQGYYTGRPLPAESVGALLGSA